jgi:speckle-type POZ protein
MASVQKIREGIFMISWINLNSSFYQHGQSNDVKVALSEMAESCKLSCVQPIRDGFYQKEIVLEIEIAFAQGRKPKNLNGINILVSKDGINKKTMLENSKWIARLGSSQQIYGKNSFVLEIVIDFTYGSTILLKKESHVLNHLLNLWNTRTLADITFRFKDKTIQAHTLIVASGSPVLDAMFKHNFKEKEEKTAIIKDIQSKVFEHLLRFIYTGDADLDNVNVASLIVAADKYGMDALKEECAVRLSQDLTIETATRNLILSHLQNSSLLYQSTVDFMSKNAKVICSRKDWMELLKKYPELGFSAMQKMVQTLQ